MSCQECMYISGHAETCSIGMAQSVGNLSTDAQSLEERLLARIEALEERVAELERANANAAYASAMEGA